MTARNTRWSPVEISSSSHPFYTNQEKMMDAAGRVEKFKARQAKATKKSL